MSFSSYLYVKKEVFSAIIFVQGQEEEHTFEKSLKSCKLKGGLSKDSWGFLKNALEIIWVNKANEHQFPHLLAKTNEY